MCTDYQELSEWEKKAKEMETEWKCLKGKKNAETSNSTLPEKTRKVHN